MKGDMMTERRQAALTHSPTTDPALERSDSTPLFTNFHGLFDCISCDTEIRVLLDFVEEIYYKIYFLLIQVVRNNVTDRKYIKNK